jgi:hypothetical protein
MIFSKKEKPIIAYTVERCPICKKESKRKFKDGDMLFAQGAECTSCKVSMMIYKIFGESTES